MTPGESSSDPLRRLKAIMTIGSLLVLIVRMAFPALGIDAVSLGLLFLAALPWLSPLVKSAKLPGGFEIEFQDVKDAAQKVTSSEPPPTDVPSSSLTYMDIADQDPSLALVALRIEIEKRLRELAELTGVPRTRSLSVLTNQLQERKVLNPDSAAGLRDLIALGNQAAHGVPVGPQAAYSAVEFGPPVLQVLDSKIVQLRGTA